MKKLILALLLFVPEWGNAQNLFVMEDQVNTEEDRNVNVLIIKTTDDFEEAIDAGASFTEQASGGHRIVVDNTTYGKDQSFVFNRGSVIEASFFAAKSIRETAELVFVGRKVSNGAAESIKSVLRSKLLELNQAEIITSSIDAPNGFREDSFVVEITGNTAEVQIHIKPVQGLDFVFITFELGDIRQSA